MLMSAGLTVAAFISSNTCPVLGSSNDSVTTFTTWPGTPRVSYRATWATWAKEREREKERVRDNIRVRTGGNRKIFRVTGRFLIDLIDLIESVILLTTIMAAVYTANTVVELDALIEREKTLNSSNLFVYITGTNGNGEFWCPDSEIAERPILDKLKELNATVIYVEVKKVGFKGNPQNEFRLHPLFLLTAVPTLYKFENDGTVNRLVEEDCSNKNLIDEFTRRK